MYVSQMLVEIYNPFAFNYSYSFSNLSHSLKSHSKTNPPSTALKTGPNKSCSKLKITLKSWFLWERIIVPLDRHFVIYPGGAGVDEGAGLDE